MKDKEKKKDYEKLAEMSEKGMKKALKKGGICG